MIARSDAEARAQLVPSLGLRDLILAQILVVVGLNALGPAARIGGSHWIYWLLGIALFHVPLAVVVIHLGGRMPAEGGAYQWARAAFGDRVGFLVGWNFWLFVVLFTSTLGLNVTTAIGYASGADSAWMASRLWQGLISAAITILLVLLAIAGFGAAKWLHNAASAALLAGCAVLLALPLAGSARAVTAAAGPAFSGMQFVLFTRVAVFALAGFECMSVVVAECRGGARAVARSIAVAVPCIAAVYILGTRSVLGFVAPSQVDLVNPVAQTFSLAFGRNERLAAAAAAMAILLVVARDFAQSSQVFGVSSRMPLVAAWDRMLPAWLTRLHPRTKTPVNAILVAGAVMLASSIAAILAAGREEAFQILLGAGGVFFGSTYLVLFAIPIAATDTPWPVRLTAIPGFLLTAAFVVLSFVPIVDVASPARFALLIAAAVVLANGTGLWLLAQGRERGSGR
jgi:amino acid transporter